MKFSNLFLLFFLVMPFTLNAQQKKEIFDYDFEVGIFSQFRTAGSYYDIDGEVIQKANRIESPDTTSWYTYDHKATIAGLYAKYKVNDQLMLGASLPFVFYSQQAVFFKSFLIYNPDPNPFSPDSINYIGRTELDELNNNRFLYVSLNSKYLILDPNEYNVIPFVEADVRIPFGFEDGTQNSSLKYWDDYFFEVIATAGTHFQFDKSQLMLQASYDLRTEDMSDLVLLYLKGGLSTVEDTELYFQAEYAQSLDEPESPFNYRRRPYAESYLNIGFGFNLVYKFLLLDVNYNLPMMGEYYWKSSILNARVGYRF